MIVEKELVKTNNEEVLVVNPIFDMKLICVNFSGRAPKVFKPGQPKLTVENEFTKIASELPNHVSFYPTIHQAFYSRYEDIKDQFEKKKLPFIFAYVYEAVITKYTRFVHPILVKEKSWNYDALEPILVSNEIEVNKVKKIKIPNPYLSKPRNEVDIYVKPFGDEDRYLEFLAPKIKYSTVDRY